MRFFFSLPYFLVIIINVVIGVVGVCKIVIKIVIDIGIGVNKNSSLIITIISISNNNIKQL